MHAIEHTGWMFHAGSVMFLIAGILLWRWPAYLPHDGSGLSAPEPMRE
jgi:hypothetical protein